MTGITIRYRVNFGQPGMRHGQRALVQPQPKCECDADMVSSATPAARQLALAYHIEEAAERGEFSGKREAARRLGVSSASITRISHLLLLAPDIQEAILDGRLLLAPVVLEPIAKLDAWDEQRREVARIAGSPA